MVRIIKNLRGIFPSQQPEKNQFSVFKHIGGGGGGRNNKSIKKLLFNARMQKLLNILLVYAVHIYYNDSVKQ